MVAAVAAVVAAGAWTAMRSVFRQPLLLRTNFRGRQVPVGAGIVIVVAMLATEAVLVVVDTVVSEPALDSGPRLLVLVIALGFGLLGFVDDVAAMGDDKGFRGHLGAMARGRLTTGGLKLVGGGLLAVVVAGQLTDSLGWLLVAAAVIALGANLGNLFDRAPGRAIKVGTLASGAVLLAASADERFMLTGVAIVLGASLGLLPFDLREDLMLGDAGANVVGAVAATGLVLTADRSVHLVALVVLAALNVASEKVSFSKVIDSFGPLRALDRLGRRP